MTRPLRVVAWNAKVGRDSAAVLDGIHELIEAMSPDVLALQEAGGYLPALRDTYGDRWRVYAHHDWPEANQCPLLVSRDFTLKERGQGWGTLRTTVDWVGPQGGVHQGRTWTWCKVNGLHVMSLHRCTDGDGRNQQAAAEERHALVQWIGKHKPALVIGDHNWGPQNKHPDASKQVARDAGGKLSHPGHGIDYAIQRGVAGTVTERGSHGSDHPAILWKRS